MKTFSRIFLVSFVWYYSVAVILYLFDVYFFRGPDRSTLGTPYVILTVHLFAGIVYGVGVSTLVGFVLRGCDFRRKTIAARISGVTIGVYWFAGDVVVEHFGLIRSSLWEDLLWLLIVPMLLIYAALFVLRRISPFPTLPPHLG